MPSNEVEKIIDKYETRFEQELSLNKTQVAHSRQLLSDLMDELQPSSPPPVLKDEEIGEIVFNWEDSYADGRAEIGVKKAIAQAQRDADVEYYEGR